MRPSRAGAYIIRSNESPSVRVSPSESGAIRSRPVEITEADRALVAAVLRAKRKAMPQSPDQT